MKKALISVFLLLAFASFAQADLNIELLGILEGENNGDEFGWYLANLGDINGDGYEDFAITAQDYPANGDSGRVYIYFGDELRDLSVDMILDNPGGVKWFGQSVCGLPDVTGDGCDEFLVGAFGYGVFLYFGGVPPDNVPDRIFFDQMYGYGFQLASGDVNSDGFSDFVVAGGGDDLAYVYLGSAEMDTVADFVLVENQVGLDGIALGDVNGDGYDDIVADRGYDGEYWTLLYFGRDSLHSEPDVWFPRLWWKGGVGDVNADGYDDIITDRHLYFGGEQIDTSNYLFLDYALFTAEVGKVNRGRYADIITDDHWGFVWDRIFIYLGGDPVDSIYDWASQTRTDNFGFDIAVVDINADGVDEFLVSQVYYPDDLRRGRVYVYAGDTTTTAVSDLTELAMPSEILLYPNYPNPFNSRTVIEFSVSAARPILSSLKIYNSRGELVKTLLDMPLIPGRYHCVWDGTNEAGEQVSSGVYLISLKSGEVHQARKALLIK